MHTPAPWTFHGDGIERMRDDKKTPARAYNIYSGNIETGGSLSQIAEVCIPMGENWGNEETKANARLIAAAPELLEALKACRNYLLGMGNLDLIEVDVMTEQAIKKAGG